MSLRYPRFYLFVGHALLWTSPTPSSVVDSHNVRVSHVHVLPLTHTQQNLTPDSPVGFAVLEYSYFPYLSNVVTGFSYFGSLTTVFSCNEALLLQLMCLLVASSNAIVSSCIIATAST